MDLKKRIAVAEGEEVADIVLKNGRIFNAFGEDFVGDVAILGDVIVGVGGEYRGAREINLNGALILPGLTDTHLHIESTMLTPSEFAAAVLAKGTTTVICDPHEIANVCGIKGVDFMAHELKLQPIDGHIMLPSCVPATSFETSGAKIDAVETAAKIKRDDIFGLGEMMNFPGVIYKDAEVLAKIEAALAAGKPIDGHIMGVSGKNYNAYLSAGIRTNHECQTAEELRQTVNAGGYCQLREGSAAKNVRELARAVNAENYRRCTFCTDDKHIDEILRGGHINENIKIAVREGIPFKRAVLMATLNAAECYALKNLGLIACGYRANIAVFDNEKNLDCKLTIVDGKIVAQNGKITYEPRRADFLSLTGTVKCEKIEAGDLKLNVKTNKLRVIEVSAGSIETRSGATEISRGANGEIILPNGVQKIAVVCRHKSGKSLSVGLIRGLGAFEAKNGGFAIAQTIAHDSHNIICTGSTDGAMTRAINRVIEIGGGVVASNGTEILAELALPIAGILSPKPAEEIAEKLSKIVAVCQKNGVPENIDPIIALSFMALPVIPHLKLTDKGLFDVDKFEFTNLDL
jgi:adenine deaminase